MRRRMTAACLTTACLTAAFLTCLPSMMLADPVMVQPIDCTLGEDCYIQYYVDRDASDGVQDFGCGALSYNGHKGTDFALISLDQMAQGVDVLSAAPGVVRGTRDGMADQLYSKETAGAIAGRECGNGVAIDHGGGWVTQYCHMKKGSLQVKTGQRVAANAVLGQVGLSGKTQFPHLHISVRQQDQVVDPFAPYATSCNAGLDAALWRDVPAYLPGGLIDLGFALKVPEYSEIKAGRAHTHQLDQSAPALVTWAYAYGSQPGDILHLSLFGPSDGDAPGPRVLEKRILLDKAQPLFFRAIGRKRPATGWAPGRYQATAKLIRNSAVLAERQVWVKLR
ncbi:putative peptidase [Thalassovita autumnalis]|uniref:Peptidase n=1 Tax=Thalassovita autumnalis TaxID=2072972 RepID=A0A0P1G4Y7_9RHOB|nr:M23 family metallopeptidase [Thalassovita autumnalis]CUH69304.1 putative peptidase [Thalassovita autumnalis]CUH74227.1 putative peptidase [Thalassovita autumnalis]